MRKTLLAIAITLSLASSSAWAATVTCQPIGDAVACSDGAVAMPLGSSSVYIMKDEPRDKWGARTRPQPEDRDNHRGR